MTIDIRQLERISERTGEIAQIAETQAIRAAANLVCAYVRAHLPEAQYLTFADEHDTMPFIRDVTTEDGTVLDHSELPENDAVSDAIWRLCRDGNVSGWSSDVPFGQYPSLYEYRLNMDDFKIEDES